MKRWYLSSQAWQMSQNASSLGLPHSVQRLIGTLLSCSVGLWCAGGFARLGEAFLGDCGMFLFRCIVLYAGALGALVRSGVRRV